METIKTVKGAYGNTIKIQKSFLYPNSIIVRDTDCMLERVYTIGNTQMLDDFEDVEIKSFAQVIRAWETGSVWF